RVDARAGDGDHAHRGNAPLHCGIGAHQPSQQLGAHARSTDRSDAHDLVRAIAHAAAQVGAVAGGLLVESKDVAVGELVVAFGPAAYLRKSWSERPWNHILRAADEDRPIAHPRERSTCSIISAL